MKKTIQTVISIILTVCMFSSFTAFADDLERPWKESETVKIIDHVVYGLDGDHWVVEDFFDTHAASESPDITKIDIKENIDGKPVTEIQNMNYYEPDSGEGHYEVVTDDNEYVTEIVLPKTIKVICHDAFSGYYSLKKINIPDGIEEIGENAFDYCGLETLTLPSINDKTLAIEGCTHLKEINFTGNPKIIGYMHNCRALSTIKFPESVEKIGSFEGSGLTKVAIKNTVKISSYGFSSNVKLKKFVFKNRKTVKKYVVPKDAFSCTPELTNFRMPKAKKIYINKYAFSVSGIEKISTKNVVKIGDFAFCDCENLKEFTIPKTIKELGNRVFEDTKLKKLYINTKNTKIISNNNTFEYLNKKCKVYVKTKAMKKAVKKAGFKGKIIIKK